MSTKLVTHKTEAEKLYLLPTGDWHWGHPNCQQEKIRDYLDWAVANDAVILLMGDLIENSTRASVGAGVYEQVQHPEAQLEDVLVLLDAYRDNILGLLTGNHEERTFKDAGFCPTRALCRELRLPYLRYGAFIRLSVGGTGYTVYASHGGSGAASSAGKLNAVKKLSAIADADVYLMGHMHELLLDTTIRKYIDLRSRTVRDRRQHYVVTGGFLSYEDSYSEMKCYPPAKIGAPRIRFSAEEHDVHVSI